MSAEVRKMVPINQIDLMKSQQTRVRTDPETVSEYAARMREGHRFPPIVVYTDDDVTFFLSDGYHRLEAELEAGRTHIDANVRCGGPREAFRDALKANSTHGLRRTREDKRHAVNLALDDEEFAQLSQRDIAELCGVSQGFVNKVIQERQQPPIDFDAGASDGPVEATTEGATASEGNGVPAEGDENAALVDSDDASAPRDKVQRAALRCEKLIQSLSAKKIKPVGPVAAALSNLVNSINALLSA
jgi:transcriptional regulator with XRE-family HTH domain/uncharacterized ParB-like nuclease family protein